ncbi:MAG: hypothetical protein K8J09_19665, partial [Planctomycetes bacterium]|nr:hypothetical protein [Planctomycetota bacterium]
MAHAGRGAREAVSGAVQACAHEGAQGGSGSVCWRDPMKQSERLLVYLVTGFLAVILVIAVVFGSEPARGSTKKTADTAKDIDEMFVADVNGAGGGVKPAVGAEKAAADKNGGAGLPSPAQVTPE